MDTTLVIGRVYGCSAGGTTKRTNAIRIHSLAASVHQGVVGLGVRVDSGRRVGCSVSAGVAVTIRVGHARGHSGGHFAVGAGGRVTPSSVAAFILSHGETTDSRQGGVVVRVEAILFHLFPALVLCALALLALPPEEDAAEH